MSAEADAISGGSEEPVRTAAELKALRQRAANMRFREVAALVEEQGWTLARTRGGHHIYRKAGARRPLVVQNDLQVGTTRDIINQLIRELEG
ncbi:MAG: type II toxin-antitoxin system HicA family toxin [Chloroflexi bacterium]|nr:type II toxin-antitoxin system HicA family toxin [Chloroflexota bacterium]